MMVGFIRELFSAFVGLLEDVVKFLSALLEAVRGLFERETE